MTVCCVQVLRWTRDWGKAKELAWQVAAAYGSNFNAISEPQPGIREWLHALSKSNVPCAIVTAFDRYETGCLRHRAFRDLDHGVNTSLSRKA